MARGFSIRFTVERKRKRERGPRFKIMACVSGSRGARHGLMHSKRCAWGGGATIRAASLQALAHLTREFKIKR